MNPKFEPVPDELLQPLKTKTCLDCGAKLRAAQFPVKKDKIYFIKHTFLAWWLRRGFVQLNWNTLMEMNFKDASIIRLIVNEFDLIEAEKQKATMDGP